MNIFEMFGFFILGSAWTIILIVIAVALIINSIKKSLNENIKTIGASIALNVDKIDKITSRFKKGDENGGNENVS